MTQCFLQIQNSDTIIKVDFNELDVSFFSNSIFYLFLFNWAQE